MRRDSTGFKVEIAFGCLVALLIGVGWLGLSRMGQINASTNHLFNERWERFYTVRQASSGFVSNNRIIARFFLTEHQGKEEISALASQIKENNAKGTAAWKKIEAEPLSDTEKVMLGKIREVEGPADESLRKMMDLLVDSRKSCRCQQNHGQRNAPATE